jgi:phage N-6-adenine-methyltransferase
MGAPMPTSPHPRVIFRSDWDSWRTPLWLYRVLDREFSFGLDAAASAENALAARYYDRSQDALAQDWGGHGSVWCNPPYGRPIPLWVQKAHEESRTSGVAVVLLLPARTDTRYFHEVCEPHGEVRLLRGRLRFLEENGSPRECATFPSMVVIFRPRKDRRSGTIRGWDPSPLEETESSLLPRGARRPLVMPSR